MRGFGFSKYVPKNLPKGGFDDLMKLFLELLTRLFFVILIWILGAQLPVELSLQEMIGPIGFHIT